MDLEAESRAELASGRSGEAAPSRSSARKGSRLARQARALEPAVEVSGIVRRGEGRGRAIGFPTANLETPADLSLENGVYAAKVGLGAEPPSRRALVHLGVRPTFGPGPRRLEAHLIDFAGALEGARLRVLVVARLCDERRWGSAGALARHIAECRDAVRQLLGGGDSRTRPGTASDQPKA